MVKQLLILTVNIIIIFIKRKYNISYGAKKSDYQILEYNMDGEKTTFKIKIRKSRNL